jgi:hypothetical protein
MKYSLLPIDVGFDLKVLGTTVLLNPGTTEVEYLTKQNKKAVVRGSRKTIKAALLKAGYKVVLEKPKKG